MRFNASILQNGLGLLMIALLAFACSKTKKPAGSNSQDIPADLQIQFGEGGGFTGMWQGYTIQADGTVSTWQGRTVGDKPEVIGKLSSEQLQALWREVQSADFFAQSLSETGNMTAILQVTANKKQHVVKWPAASAQALPQAASLQQLQSFCQKLVDSLEKE